MHAGWLAWLTGSTHGGTRVHAHAGCVAAADAQTLALLLLLPRLRPQQPLFPGDSEWQQLLQIFKLLGTPSEHVWPGVSRLRDW